MGCFLISGQKCRTLVKENPSSPFSGGAVARVEPGFPRGTKCSQAGQWVWAVLRKQWAWRNWVWSLVLLPTLSFDFSSFICEVSSLTSWFRVWIVFLDSRVSCRLVVLLKALLKLICDVARDSSLTPEPVKSALLEEATDCLLLLDCCSQGQVKVRDSMPRGLS